MSVFSEPIDWIKQSIDSILTQTYRDFEFIIVNDNPDRNDLKELLVDYSNRDNRIITVLNEENIGLTKSLNKALKIASGDYIARMDADDYSHPERFKKQITFLENNPDVVLVGCYARIMNEKGRIIGETHTSDDYMYLVAMFPFMQPVYHPTMMYRREIGGAPVCYNENMRASQDYELCSRLISYRITNIPEYLLNYRMSPNQMTQRFKEKYIDYSGTIRKRTLFKMYNGMSDNDADALISLYYRSNCDSKQVKDVGEFILHLYNNNKNNESVYIDSAITFLLIKYLKFLFQNTSGVKALISFIRVNHSLGNRFYIKAISKLTEKFFSNVRYKFSRV